MGCSSGRRSISLANPVSQVRDKDVRSRLPKRSGQRDRGGEKGRMMKRIAERIAMSVMIALTDEGRDRGLPWRRDERLRLPCSSGLQCLPSSSSCNSSGEVASRDLRRQSRSSRTKVKLWLKSDPTGRGEGAKEAGRPSLTVEQSVDLMGLLTEWEHTIA